MPDVGVRLFDGDTGLEARESSQVKPRQYGAASIELKWENQINLSVCNLEAGRHYADNFARAAIDDDFPAGHRTVATESPLPIAVAQQHMVSAKTIANRVGYIGSLIGREKGPADFRLDGERLE